MREIYTARLQQKLLLSAAAQCYHFAFSLDEAAPPALAPGQFLSLLAEDAAGKTYTRAYSIASAPRRAEDQGFDLCVNRVEGGFFSNLLCDMREGEAIRCHGPHGLFTLKEPPAHGLLIAAGTGIAPMRGFAQWLFPEGAADRSEGREYWLVYEAPQLEELFYNSYFKDLAARHANFHYLPVAGGESDHARMEQEIVRIRGEVAPASPGQAAPSQTGPEFGAYAYVCGLSEMVKAARAQLFALGWQKRQVLFERYD